MGLFGIEWIFDTVLDLLGIIGFVIRFAIANPTPALIIAGIFAAMWIVATFKNKEEVQ